MTCTGNSFVVENHPSTSALLTFSVIVCKRPRPSDFSLWFQVGLGMWYWKLDLLQVTWSPKDSQLPCSIFYVSVFFPPDSMILHHMRFNVFLQTLAVESCSLLWYTVSFWPLGFPSSVLQWLWDQVVFEEKHHTDNPSCLPSCQITVTWEETFFGVNLY